MNDLFRTRFNRKVVISPSGGNSLTDQQFAKTSEVNYILRNYNALTPNPRTPIFGDVSDFGDFERNFAKIQKAQADFESLGEAVVSRFGRNPLEFYRFVHNPANREECIRLGLYRKPVSPTPVGESVAMPDSVSPLNLTK